MGESKTKGSNYYCSCGCGCYRKSTWLWLVRLYVDRHGQERALRMAEHMFASHFNISKTDKAVLEITEDKLTRSQKQNKLFWAWMTILGEFHGHHKNEMAEILQQSILGETSFVSKLDGAKINKQERAKYLTVGQFKNFLEQIEVHAAEYGVRLPSEEEMNSDNRN